MTSATIFPDTTILIQYQAFDRIDWNAMLGVDQVRLMISGSVWQELEDIKDQDISPSLARRAQMALNRLREHIEQPVDPAGPIQMARLNDPTIDFEAEGLDPTSVSDVLVASVISYQQAHALEFVTLFTDDAETRQKAHAAGIEVGSLPDNYLTPGRTASKRQTAAPGTGVSQAMPKTPTADHLTKSGLFFHSAPYPLKNAPAVGNEALSRARPAATHTDTAETEYTEPAHSNRRQPATENPQAAEPGPSKEEYVPPFLEIKQEPAQPDPGYVELFNLPKRTEEKANGAPPQNPLTLPKIAIDTDQADKPSFSLKKQKPVAEPENPLEPLIPGEQANEKTELRLAFGKDETRTTVIIHHPVYPTIDDISEHLSSLRNKYPKLTDVIGSNSGDGIGNDWASPAMSDEILHQRRAHRIKRYNNELNTFYTRTEKYLSETAEFENFRRRSAQLNLSLFNDLPDSLKSLYIAIHFPGNMQVYAEGNLPEKPLDPTPPEKPDLEALFEKIRLPSVPVPGEILGSGNIKLRSGHIAPIEIRWNKGWDVIYSIREIGKNESLSFNPLFIVFNSFDHATSFRIHYRITVASASYEERGELEVLVRKEF